LLCGLLPAAAILAAAILLVDGRPGDAFGVLGRAPLRLLAVLDVLGLPLLLAGVTRLVSAWHWGVLHWSVAKPRTRGVNTARIGPTPAARVGRRCLTPACPHALLRRRHPTRPPAPPGSGDPRGRTCAALARTDCRNRRPARTGSCTRRTSARPAGRGSPAAAHPPPGRSARPLRAWARAADAPGTAAPRPARGRGRTPTGHSARGAAVAETRTTSSGCACVRPAAPRARARTRPPALRRIAPG